ncbi:19971_t:CDS:2, partial [Racocetra fulgida]
FEQRGHTSLLTGKVQLRLGVFEDGDQSEDDNIHLDLNQRTDYIKNLMADLPPAPTGLVIKEKEDHELGTPLAPSPNQQDTYDSVEGFRTDFQNEKDEEPQTKVQNENNVEPQKNIQNEKNGKLQKNIQNEKNDQNEKNVEPPKKVVKKKKKIVLQMSLFGKIWTALDRMTTPRTRKRFQGVNSLTLNSDDSSSLCDDKQLHITANIESELIELTKNDKSGPFKDLLGNLKLTIEEMDAFVRVLR